MRNGQRQLGDKLGPRISQLMVESTVAARARLAPHEARVHQAAQKALIDMAGEEKAAMLRPLFRHVLKHPDTHPVIRDFVEKGTSGHHQWQAELFSGAVSAGVYGLFGEVLDNIIAPVVYDINKATPNLVSDPPMAARTAAQGFNTIGYAAQSAHFHGYTYEAANDFYNASLTFPAPSQIFDMLNRGIIDDARAVLLLRRNALAEDAVAELIQTKESLLSIADAALATLRGNISEAEGERIAARTGFSAESFKIFLDNTGEPPSVTDLAMGLRRGIIDKARFSVGVRQSRVRDEWIDFLEQVQYSPMSVADAITALVQGHLTEAQAKSIANDNGLRPQDFQPLYETAGEPISRTEVIELLRRGEIDHAAATQAIKESRLKDKYINDVFKLTRQLPPAREVATLYSHGALTQAQAESLLAQSGYDSEVQKAFIESAVHGKVAALKNITLSQASRLYVESIISWAEAEKLLAKTGYQPTELAYVKEILDNQRVFRNRESAITKIRSLYVAYHITEQQASVQIDALHVASGERDELIALWKIEREANARPLTTAQITDAYEYNLVDANTAVALLESAGYSHTNAVLILEVKAKGPIAGLS